MSLAEHGQAAPGRAATSAASRPRRARTVGHRASLRGDKFAQAVRLALIFRSAPIAEVPRFDGNVLARAYARGEASRMDVEAR
jgi:hypothetical protein